MDKKFKFLQDILRENNSHISSNLQSIATQLQNISKIRQQNLFPGNDFLKAIEKSQRRMNLLGQNILLSQRSLQNNLNLQDYYNFTGLFSFQNKFNEIAKSHNNAFNSIAHQLANQVSKSNFRFTNSFQSVAKILSDQKVGIPDNILQEFRYLGEKLATINLGYDKDIDEIIDSIDDLAEHYNDESIKKYTFGEVIHTVIFYISFILALHNFITNSDSDIISNQTEIIKNQQELENKISMSITQNKKLLEKVYKMDPTELESFVVTKKMLNIREEPNDSSASKIELNANAVVQVIDKKNTFARINFFDFENHESVEGWIPIKNSISLKLYLKE